MNVNLRIEHLAGDMKMATEPLSQEEILQFRAMRDRAQIVEGIYSYARAMDRADVALMISTFWEDGRFDGGPVPGVLWQNADDMINIAVARRFANSQHLFCNILTRIEGDLAFVESYAIVYHRTFPTHDSIVGMIGAARLEELGGRADIPYDLIMGLRYLDHWEKRNGLWKITVRKLVPDWSMTQPSSTLEHGGIMDHLKWAGTRGRADPSYGTYADPN